MHPWEVDAHAVGQDGRPPKDWPLPNGPRLVDQALRARGSFLAQPRTHSRGQEQTLSAPLKRGR